MFVKLVYVTTKHGILRLKEFYDSLCLHFYVKIEGLQDKGMIVDMLIQNQIYYLPLDGYECFFKTRDFYSGLSICYTYLKEK